MELEPRGAGRPGTAAGPTVDHAKQRPDRKPHALSNPWLERRPRPGVHPDLAPAIVLAMPYQNRSAAPVEVGLGQRQRLPDPQPGGPQHYDQRVEAMAVASVPGLAHDRDDLIDRRGS